MGLFVALPDEKSVATVRILNFSSDGAPSPHDRVRL